tara:strand:- start:3730 stop:3963 length:234 start_codon:yes stop_codon:yes gene_type:complete
MKINGAQLSYDINIVHSPDPQGYAQNLLLNVQEYLSREDACSDAHDNNSTRLWIAKQLARVEYIIEHELTAKEDDDA